MMPNPPAYQPSGTWLLRVYLTDREYQALLVELDARQERVPQMTLEWLAREKLRRGLALIGEE
jgi:hypothetical protein